MRTKIYALAFLVFLVNAFTANAQNIISQWNFNSVPPDANTATGTLLPAVGSGTVTAVGGVNGTGFASGTASGGSSDPSTGDNSGWALTSFPAATVDNKSAGFQFAASTAGRSNIVVRFDLRHSNTGPRHFTLQYTADVTATPVVWSDFITDSTTAGDVWNNGRTYDMSIVTTLNNNISAGFRVVAAFSAATNSYVAAQTGSAYAGTGTWRVDMLTIRDTTYPSLGAVTFVGTRTDINETTTQVKVLANIAGGTGAASAEIEILPWSTAASGSDYTLPATMRFNWPANANNVRDSLTFLINNDVLPEPSEYFIIRLKNAVNATLPAETNNHYTVMMMDDDRQAPAATQSVKLQHIASFSNGTSGTNSAEIVAHDPVTQRLFVANSIAGKIDIINFSNPAAASLISSINIKPWGNINSIAIRNGVVAAAVENNDPQAPGKVVFYNTNGDSLKSVDVGAMPDMITFNRAGNKVLTANEGEPNTNYTIDPEGSVSIIDLAGGIATLTNANVTNVSFASFNGQLAALRAAGVRIFGPGATVAKDLEPEYIALSDDDQTAYVTCQENNAVAVLDMTTSTITSVRSLGTKDHAAAGNALDVSDQNLPNVQIANWPVRGLYMPDAIASYKVAGQTYLVTANEGDAREYTGYSEIVRLSAASYVLDPVKFPNAGAIKANLGRLNVTTASGDTDGDGDFDEIHAFGSRSFSIFNATTGALVWDSKDDMELITSKHPVFGALFNASNANNTLKNRSDDKGPEPEGIALGDINGKNYAFVALERIGGCMVYDITDPANPIYVDYANTRSVGTYGGDNGAEGVIYIPALQSPTGVPIVILANEVSSTLSFFNVNATVLNIKLTTIAAHNKGSVNKVNWVSASETLGDVYELQRSSNGQNFEQLTTIAAKGVASLYDYVDINPLKGNNYYRLKMVNVDGSIAYSKVLKAIVNEAASWQVKAYPNPTQHQFTLLYNGTPTQNATVTITNSVGATIYTSTLVQPQTIDTSKWPTGAYTIVVSGTNDVQTIKIIKQ